MSYSFQNTDPGDQHVTSVIMDMATDYARVTDEPDLARLSNRTASLEQPEVITYKAAKIGKVSPSIPVRNPSPVQDGVLYSARLETINRFTNGTEVVDEPIVMWVNIKHPLSNNWTNDAVATILKRLVSSLMKSQSETGTPGEASSSNWRFEDMMRSALMPAED